MPLPTNAVNVRLPNGTTVRVDTTQFGEPGEVVQFFRGSKPFQGPVALAEALVHSLCYDGKGRLRFALNRIPRPFQVALSRATIVTADGEPVRAVRR